MSMNQTKGKQKIEMKKVESYKSRMIAFSKRKSGIHKKMNEITISCGVEAAFLVFSQAGKPYTFANPSMEKVFSRLTNPLRYEPFSKEDGYTETIVKAYKRQKIEDLMKHYMDLVEEAEMDKEKEKFFKEVKNEENLEKMWWNKDMSVEESMRRHRDLVDLHDNLCDEVISRMGKDGDVEIVVVCKQT